MSTTLNINVTGYKETNESLKNIREELGDMLTPLVDSGSYYLKEIDANFETKGMVFSNGWQPLANSTIIEKQNLAKEGRAIETNYPLIRSGFLRRSFVMDILSKFKIEINSLAPYAGLMHNGGISSRGGKVPARTLMRVDDERERKITNIFSNWIRNIVNNSFYNK
jgi:phage gpG-like protein